MYIYLITIIGVNILLIKVKYRRLTSLYVPMSLYIYNIIVLSITSTHIENYHHYWYYFCFTIIHNLGVSRGEEICIFFTPLPFFTLFTFLPSFSMFYDFFYCFLSVSRNSHSHSLRVDLLAINSLSFPFSENVLIPSSFLKYTEF